MNGNSRCSQAPMLQIGQRLSYVYTRNTLSLIFGAYFSDNTEDLTNFKPQEWLPVSFHCCCLPGISYQSFIVMSLLSLFGRFQHMWGVSSSELIGIQSSVPKDSPRTVKPCKEIDGQFPNAICHFRLPSALNNPGSQWLQRLLNINFSGVDSVFRQTHERPKPFCDMNSVILFSLKYYSGKDSREAERKTM